MRDELAERRVGAAPRLGRGAPVGGILVRHW